MNVRPVAEEDFEDVEQTARRSFRTSYSLSPQEIETLLESVFSPESLERRAEADDATILVADLPEGFDVEIDVDIAGFAGVDPDETLRWLHVHPHARGRGVGTTLVEHVREEVVDDDPFTAGILETASEGDQFMERFELYRTDTRDLEVGAESFDEQIYTSEATEETEEANEPTVSVPETDEVDGEKAVLRREEDISGAESPFFPLYESDEFEEPVGFFCSQCGSTDVFADSLDRLECEQCGNGHKSDDWDGSYL